MQNQEREQIKENREENLINHSQLEATVSQIHTVTNAYIGTTPIISDPVITSMTDFNQQVNSLSQSININEGALITQPQILNQNTNFSQNITQHQIVSPFQQTKNDNLSIVKNLENIEIDFITSRLVDTNVTDINNIAININPSSTITGNANFNSDLINVNSYQDDAYGAHFNHGYRVSPSIRSSRFTMDDLQEDSIRLSRSSGFNINASTTIHNDCLEYEDWEYIKPENIAQVEIDFCEIEQNVIKSNKQDLYKLYSVINNCKLDGTSVNNREKMPTIGPISTLEYMVESTFGFHNDLKSAIREHYLVLEPHIFRWRSISGDGNCFYRAVIFAFLENVIFEKNIQIIKFLIVEIYKKFDEKYPDTRNLSHLTRKAIVGLNKILVLKILYLILEILEGNTDDKVYRAYEILLKCFNFCTAFDMGMILYFRYKLYEYIKNNENRAYTKEFCVKIGNLLPAEYETESGDFLYEKFFDEYLMKLNVDAEKIIIYLTPFVLKVNLRIIIYEFDNDNSTLSKDFPCHIDNKPWISVLFRKTHYDLIYSSDYFNCHNKELCQYINLKENLRVFKTELSPSKVPIKDVESMFTNSPKVILTVENNNNLNAGILPVCNSCNNQYTTTSNVFNLCIICLKREVEEQIIANYSSSLMKAHKFYEAGREDQIADLFKYGVKNYGVTQAQDQVFEFRNFPVTLKQLSELADINHQAVLDRAKTNVCVVCQRWPLNNINSAICILPCGCYMCNSQCVDLYFQYIFGKAGRVNKKHFYCFCGYQFNGNDFKQLYGYLNTHKLKDFKKHLEYAIISSFTRSCLLCLEDHTRADDKFHVLKLKDKEIVNSFKIKEFRHIVCGQCYYNTPEIKE